MPGSTLSCWSSSAGPILAAPGTFRVNGSFSCTGAFSGERQELHSFQQNLPSMALIVPSTQLVWRLANIDSLRKGFVLALGVSYEYRAKPGVLEQGSREAFLKNHHFPAGKREKEHNVIIEPYPHFSASAVWQVFHFHCALWTWKGFCAFFLHWFAVKPQAAIKKWASNVFACFKWR